MRPRKRLFYFAILFFSMYLIIRKTNYETITQSNSRRAAVKNNGLMNIGSGDVYGPFSGLKEAPPPFTAVIILTYMRSGSSLTGDILQQSPGAFYVYEPLRLLERLVKLQPGAPLRFVNGTIRTWPVHYDEEAVNIIRNWIVCNVTKLPESSLSDGFLGMGFRLRNYRKCYGGHFKITRNKSLAIDACISKLKTECEHSSIRVIKAIRLPLNLISHLMEEIPGLKIVHLVRDPRATLRSQMSFGMCSQAKHGGRYNCTNNYCTRLENDKAAAEDLSRRHKGRVTTVFYEDIAARPIETSKKLFDFIGATFTRNAEEYVYNITLAGNDNKCAICTSRANSSVYIDKWKTKTSSEFLGIIQDRCKNILQHYHYSLVTLPIADS